MRNGEIDLYPEYDGTAYGIHLGHKEPITDPSKVFDQVKREFEDRFKMTWSTPFGFNNTYAIAMPQSLAEQNHIKTISDLAPLSNKFVLGTTNEFMGRSIDGFKPLAAAYGLKFKDVKTMTTGLRYTAVKQNEIQVMDAYSTDGKLKEFKLLILEDDKQFFPPYKGATVIRMDTLAKNPGLLDPINKLGGTMTDEIMRDLNYQVEVKGETIQAVAHAFLKSKGFVK
jgi:osmoprotectant transport system substrate-binding protein